MTTFEKLSAIDVKEHVEQKGKFDYLSWPHAVAYLLKSCPEATWEVKREEGRPYFSTDAGPFVEVAVTVDGITRTQIHPVLDGRNAVIKEPDAFQINTSIQRCLVKAIALHGLGLSVYAGEDLPTDGTAARKTTPKPAEKPPTHASEKMASEKQISFIKSLARGMKVADPTANKDVTAAEATSLIKELKEGTYQPPNEPTREEIGEPEGLPPDSECPF